MIHGGHHPTWAPQSGWHLQKKGISWSVGNSNLDGKQTPTVSYLWNDHPFASHFGVHFGWVLTTEALKTNSPLQGPSLPPAGCPEIMVFWRKWGQCLISYWKIRKSDNKTIRKSQEITILKLVFLSVACIRMSEEFVGTTCKLAGYVGFAGFWQGCSMTSHPAILTLQSFPVSVVSIKLALVSTKLEPKYPEND